LKQLSFPSSLILFLLLLLMTSWTQMLCLKYLDKFQEWVSHTKARKNVHINICPFVVQTSNFLTSNLWIFICGGHLKTLVYSAPIENGEMRNQHIFMLVKSQQHRCLQKGAAVHDQTKHKDQFLFNSQVHKNNTR
jgi:hypothetical protein